MKAVWTDGVLFVPVRVEMEGVLGDAMLPVGPDYPDYAEWLATATVLKPVAEYSNELLEAGEV